LMKRKRNKPTCLAVILPSLVTMLVSGIWHGTGWNFLVWGLYHGVVIAVTQLLAKPITGGRRSIAKVFSAWLVTNTLLFFSWAIFRTTSPAWLSRVLFQSPFILGSVDLSVCLASFSFVVFYLALYLLEFVIHHWNDETTWIRTFFYVGITLLIFIYSNSASPDFIYTHF